MTYAEIIAAWNAQADAMNQWSELSEQEKVEWAWKYALERAANVCVNFAQKAGLDAMGAEEDGEEQTAAGRREAAWMLSNCAVAIRAMKDKP